VTSCVRDKVPMGMIKGVCDKAYRSWRLIQLWEHLLYHIYKKFVFI